MKPPQPFHRGIKPNDSHFPSKVSDFDSLINDAALRHISRIKVEGKWKALCTGTNSFQVWVFEYALKKMTDQRLEDSERSKIHRVQPE